MTKTYQKTIMVVVGSRVKRDEKSIVFNYQCVWKTQSTKRCHKQDEQNGRFREQRTKHVHHLLAILVVPTGLILSSEYTYIHVCKLMFYASACVCACVSDMVSSEGGVNELNKRLCENVK